MTDARLLITAVVVEKRSVAEVAVQYGVSRSWLYELLARYRREGEAAFWLRSRRPRTSPLETPPETVELIVRLRKELCEQGLDAGPDTVCWHLAHHYNVVVSRATVSRYLAKHGLVTPQPRKRPRSSYIRFQAAMPNECWQSDFTQWDGDRAGSTEISLTRARLVPGAGGCSLHQRHRIHEVSYVDGGPARFAGKSERLVRCRPRALSIRSPRSLASGVADRRLEKRVEITCGVDWAEDHHDVAVMDDQGRVLASGRIGVDVAGYSELIALIVEHGGSAADTPVAIETDKNLLVLALRASGFTVYPINPRAVARYRERHHQAGKKSDAGDAAVLADILRTDRHQHRSLPAVSDEALAVKALARQHQEAIWALHQNTSRLRSMLLEFYPQALKAFPNLTHKTALTVLAAAPTPTKARRLTRRGVVALLHRCGRRNDPDLVERILTELKAPALHQPAPVEAALGLAAKSLIDVLVRMHEAVATLNAALAEQFDQHHLAPILRSAPGLGPVLAARILGEVGDDPSRFETAANLRAFAGTAPVTRASGRSNYVKARKVRNKRLGDACHWWAYSTLTKSPGARAYYDHRRAIGDTHNAALRNVANKLPGRLWWCLQNHQPWDDSAAWPTLTKPPQTAAA